MGSGKKRSASFVDDSDGHESPSIPSGKKSKSAASAAAPAGKDDEGNPFWELSNKRRAGVSQFKGATFVNVREYYEKDGKMLPGKKGISLSVEQYSALLKAAPGINAALFALGQIVDDEAEEAAEEPAVIKKSKKEKKQNKSNIEATSDEESS